ncbi:glycosyltransferase family 2 protein [Vibrio sp. JC009]|uniref:glycosyltransferase family 2 protein n=1 Tax=Vibrio sp. JC009 TaxID=2912314 RepID=UPI0023B00710|nr:glycosyltransferase family 2 protein [Vibrio sp. JC009]WED22013.1 glycosyltransferase family 2 protein [Vibrio sp. JC009]
MIIIPMAGMSSRFFKAGYTQPKYMLKAHGKSLFDHAVTSFENYFDTLPFLFIVKDVYNTVEFVKSRILALGIKKYEIVVLNNDTRGQAETVFLGLDEIIAKNSSYSDLPITIFNIDTFRPNFKFPEITTLGNGYLEVFRGAGDNWSFVLPRDTNLRTVEKTAEKSPISDLCCTGLYHFKAASVYIAAYSRYIEKPMSEWEKGELYVAPLYNMLLDEDKTIHYHIIDRQDVIFCGVPAEYTAFKAK